MSSLVPLSRINPRRGGEQFFRRLVGRHTVDACASDAEALGYLSCAESVGPKLGNVGPLDGRGAAFVDTGLLGGCYALKLAFTAKIGLEFREDAEQSRKHLPAAVDVSIGCSVAFSVAPFARSSRTMS